MEYFSQFKTHRLSTASGVVFARVGGNGPPLLLLHGFPQTHLMWHQVARGLAERFTVIAADLPGYGNSTVRAVARDLQPYSKRAMAATLVEAMRQLEFPRFFVAGHDRGARVAYRMALDHSDAVERCIVMDITPTADAFAKMDRRSAMVVWPFTFLAQAYPFPESVFGGNPAAFVEHCLATWSRSDVFPKAVRDEYVAAVGRPETIHAICQEYRAAATVDCEVDEADRGKRKISCPLLSLWSKHGLVERALGGLSAWDAWAENATGVAMDCGHFIPEELPVETERLMVEFLSK